MSHETTIISRVLQLSFGEGNIGADYDFASAAVATGFAQKLNVHTKPLTYHNTADCVDERPTLFMADRTAGQALRDRIVPQLPGGLVLATTKACVAANVGFLSDARSFQHAYELISIILEGMGEQDGGHEGCGASQEVERSVAHALPIEVMFGTIGALRTMDETERRLLEEIQASKRRRLEAGFFGSWKSSWQEERLFNRVPQNFSYLKVQPGPTHGHHGRGVYIVPEGTGFCKNVFVEDIGQQAFAFSAPKARQLAHKLGATQEDRARINLAFLDDLFHVGNRLFAPGMSVFA